MMSEKRNNVACKENDGVHFSELFRFNRGSGIRGRLSQTCKCYGLMWNMLKRIVQILSEDFE